MRRRVVVTGLGVVAPNGVGVPAFSEALWAGKPAVTRISCFDPSGHASQIAGQAHGFTFDHSGLPGQLRNEDRFVHLAAAASLEAVTDAGLDMGRLDPERAGTSIANAVAGTKLMAEHFAEITGGGLGPVCMDMLHPLLHRAATFNTASSAVAALFGLEGPCSTMCTGCTGGNDAIGFAVDVIRRGEADVMIAGAAEGPITPLVVACFDVIGALSTSNVEPHRASRPFDRRRDGFVLGEGAGIFVLEEWEHARRRGATIYAEVAGYGTTCNAFHMTDLPAAGEDLARSLTLALADAGVPRDNLDYINAHGSSTPQNDICETAAIKLALGATAYRVPVSSTKSMIGHALAAANAIEMVACTLAIRHQLLPPTINLEDPDPACDLDYVPNMARESRVRTIASLSSGFGGIHSTVIIQSIG